ncbi:hypothetical protein D3C81_1752770 [compost metagenome]
MRSAQIAQPHPYPQQAHRLATPGECLPQKLSITFKVPPGPCLLHRGLAEVMELDLDERLVRPITAVHTGNTLVQALQQLG